MKVFIQHDSLREIVAIEVGVGSDISELLAQASSILHVPASSLRIQFRMNILPTNGPLRDCGIQEGDILRIVNAASLQEGQPTITRPGTAAPGASASSGAGKQPVTISLPHEISLPVPQAVSAVLNKALSSLGAPAQITQAPPRPAPLQDAVIDQVPGLSFSMKSRLRALGSPQSEMLISMAKQVAADAAAHPQIVSNLPLLLESMLNGWQNAMSLVYVDAIQRDVREQIGEPGAEAAAASSESDAMTDRNLVSSSSSTSASQHLLANPLAPPAGGGLAPVATAAAPAAGDTEHKTPIVSESQTTQDDILAGLNIPPLDEDPSNWLIRSLMDTTLENLDPMSIVGMVTGGGFDAQRFDALYGPLRENILNEISRFIEHDRARMLTSHAPASPSDDSQSSERKRSRSEDGDGHRDQKRVQTQAPGLMRDTKLPPKSPFLGSSFAAYLECVAQKLTSEVIAGFAHPEKLELANGSHPSGALRFRPGLDNPKAISDRLRPLVLSRMRHLVACLYFGPRSASPAFAGRAVPAGSPRYAPATSPAPVEPPPAGFGELLKGELLRGCSILDAVSEVFEDGDVSLRAILTCTIQNVVQALPMEMRMMAGFVIGPVVSLIMTSLQKYRQDEEMVAEVEAALNQSQPEGAPQQPKWLKFIPEGEDPNLWLSIMEADQQREEKYAEAEAKVAVMSASAEGKSIESASDFYLPILRTAIQATAASSTTSSHDEFAKLAASEALRTALTAQLKENLSKKSQ